jgi:hypothetical protein
MNDTLEHLIDTNGLVETLEAIQTICYEKAEHLRANWEDDTGARAWDRAATLIARLVTKISVRE